KSGEQTTGEADGDDGLYKGKSAYQSQLPTGSQKFAPIKGPSSDIRTITLMDYQPDRCKDYAETGWCGFGDSCKFLHDRSDYKSGWEMDNSFLSNQPKKLVEEVVEEELPFACLICREPFGDPKSPHAAVVTRCGHYFGGSCAIKRYAKNSKCFACGASTQGIFNKADKILDRMEKLQQARLKKAKDEEGHDYDADGDGGFEIEGLAEE
ncbi:hypothetical protein P389DRAFT_132985, partial [Cystobasidium minutum MCA 4210]|uniref:uncharacterized protein n=1 Tax=Cystobasidium minutum MCA 4210 TaxID=1397322 RepID=UPI0034CE8781